MPFWVPVIAAVGVGARVAGPRLGMAMASRTAGRAAARQAARTGARSTTACRDCDQDNRCPVCNQPGNPRQGDRPPDYVNPPRKIVDHETVLSGPGFTRTGHISPNNSVVYVDGAGNSVYRDTFHSGRGAHLEVFSRNGEHLGEMCPYCGRIKPNSRDPSKTYRRP